MSMRQRLGGLVEDFLGTAVGQAGASGDGVEVGGGQGDAGAPAGEEHRSAGAAVEQPGQEAGGAGLPDDDVDGGSFSGDLGAPVAAVEVLDVEREHLAGPGG